MKIGILTQPLKSNYGGILQNWALQQALKKLGHEPITIDYLASASLDTYLKSNLYAFLSFLKGRGKYHYIPYYKKRTSLFDDFVKSHIQTTRQVTCYRKSILQEYRIEAVVVGSDQVWRPMYTRKTLYNMYMDFVGDSYKKIVYAASFGTDKIEYSTKQIADCKKMVSSIDAISVREKSGIDLCRKMFGHNSQLVLDPTLLLQKEDYLDLIRDIPRLSEAKFAVAYILNPSNVTANAIQKVVDEEQLSVININADSNASLSILQWISAFRDAEVVVTDSFHGSVFSIIFGKKLVCLGNNQRGSTRFDTITSLLQNNNLEDNRKESYQFLIDNLK